MFRPIKFKAGLTSKKESDTVDWPENVAGTFWDKSDGLVFSEFKDVSPVNVRRFNRLDQNKAAAYIQYSCGRCDSTAEGKVQKITRRNEGKNKRQSKRDRQNSAKGVDKGTSPALNTGLSQVEPASPLAVPTAHKKRSESSLGMAKGIPVGEFVGSKMEVELKGLRSEMSELRKQVADLVDEMKRGKICSWSGSPPCRSQMEVVQPPTFFRIPINQSEMIGQAPGPLFVPSLEVTEVPKEKGRSGKIKAKDMESEDVQSAATGSLSKLKEFIDQRKEHLKRMSVSKGLCKIEVEYLTQMAEAKERFLRKAVLSDKPRCTKPASGHRESGASEKKSTVKKKSGVRRRLSVIERTELPVVKSKNVNQHPTTSERGKPTNGKANQATSEITCLLNPAEEGLDKVAPDQDELADQGCPDPQSTTASSVKTEIAENQADDDSHNSLEANHSEERSRSSDGNDSGRLLVDIADLVSENSVHSSQIEGEEKATEYHLPVESEDRNDRLVMPDGDACRHMPSEEKALPEWVEEGAACNQKQTGEYAFAESTAPDRRVYESGDQDNASVSSMEDWLTTLENLEEAGRFSRTDTEMPSTEIAQVADSKKEDRQLGPSLSESESPEDVLSLSRSDTAASAEAIGDGEDKSSPPSSVISESGIEIFAEFDTSAANGEIHSGEDRSSRMELVHSRDWILDQPIFRLVVGQPRGESDGF